MCEIKCIRSVENGYYLRIYEDEKSKYNNTYFRTEKEYVFFKFKDLIKFLEMKIAHANEDIKT